MSEPGGSTLDRAQRGFRSDSLEDLFETARLTRNENPRWRLVLPVTRGTREFIYEQMPALVTTYAVAMALTDTESAGPTPRRVHRAGASAVVDRAVGC